MKKLMLMLCALTVITASPVLAQTTGAPLFSVQRLSIGVGGDFTKYQEADVQHFRAVLPVSYNLGRYVSLTGRAAIVLDPKDNEKREKEYSVGFVLHLLARGKKP